MGGWKGQAVSDDMESAQTHSTDVETRITNTVATESICLRMYLSVLYVGKITLSFFFLFIKRVAKAQEKGQAGFRAQRLSWAEPAPWKTCLRSCCRDFRVLPMSFVSNIFIMTCNATRFSLTPSHMSLNHWKVYDLVIYKKLSFLCLGVTKELS